MAVSAFQKKLEKMSHKDLMAQVKLQGVPMPRPRKKPNLIKALIEATGEPDDLVAYTQRWVDHLREMGRLEEIDELQVQIVLRLADACQWAFTNAPLWQQLREAVMELRGWDDDEDGQSLLSEIFGGLPAENRDTP